MEGSAGTSGFLYVHAGYKLKRLMGLADLGDKCAAQSVLPMRSELMCDRLMLLRSLVMEFVQCVSTALHEAKANTEPVV